MAGYHRAAEISLTQHRMCLKMFHQSKYQIPAWKKDEDPALHIECAKIQQQLL